MARRDLDEWLWQVGSELERLSEELTPAVPKFARRRAWSPRVDVAETDSHLFVRAEIAGVRGEDIRVTLSEDARTLAIRGSRPPQNLVDERSDRYHQLEIDFGDFERVVTLPERSIDRDRVRAQYRNGFLVVALPKKSPQAVRIGGRRVVTIRSVQAPNVDSES